MTTTQRIDLADSFARLHDGRLTAVALEPNGVVRIGVADASMRRYEIVAAGVERLYATDFREGNIILDITWSPGIEASLDELCALYQMNSVNRQN